MSSQQDQKQKQDTNKTVGANVKLSGAEPKQVDNLYVIQEPSHPDNDVDDGWTKLHEAASNLNLPKLQEILSSATISVNQKTSQNSEAPIHLVVNHMISDSGLNKDVDKVLQALDILAHHKADPNTFDSDSSTPLHYCAYSSHDRCAEVANRLIKMGADVNITHRNSPQVHPSHQCDQSGCSCGSHVGSLLSAISGDDDYSKPYIENKSPLHTACRHKNLMMVKVLLDNGAKVDIFDDREGTPMHQAAISGDFDVCQLLLEREEVKATFTMADDYGRTPISNVAESDTASADIARLLITNGSPVDFVIGLKSFRTGSTPLALACEKPITGKPGNEDIVRTFLENGANPLNLAENQKPVLLRAMKGGNVHIVRMLLSHGANLEDLEALGAPALHTAASAGRNDLCRFLVEEMGADVNQETNDGEKSTPLIMAAGYSNSVETVTTLISLGAKVEARMYDGRSALHFAALKPNTEAQRAAIGVPGKEKREVAQREAALKGKPGIVRVLLDSLADIEGVDANDWTPLHFAARYHRLDVVELLLQRGAQVGKTVKGGPCPQKADGEEFDITGYTAADLARITRGGQPVVDVLVAAGDHLSDETKDLTDEDLWEDRPMQVQCNQQ